MTVKDELPRSISVNMLLKRGEITPERVKRWVQSEKKKHPAVDVTGNGSKVQKSKAVKSNIA